MDCAAISTRARPRGRFGVNEIAADDDGESVVSARLREGRRAPPPRPGAAISTRARPRGRFGVSESEITAGHDGKYVVIGEPTKSTAPAPGSRGGGARLR